MKKSLFYWLIVSIFLLGSYFWLRELLLRSDGTSPIVFELTAAILGSIITVSAMAVLMRIQASQDREKEYASRVFDHKIDTYRKLANAIFESDDDNLLTKEEIGRIENLVGLACLVADATLVARFSQFVVQLKWFGVMYFRSLSNVQAEQFRLFVERERQKDADESQLCPSKKEIDGPVEGKESDFFVSLDEILQGMRRDLAVVDGDISTNVGHFIMTRYDELSLIKNPNVID